MPDNKREIAQALEIIRQELDKVTALAGATEPVKVSNPLFGPLVHFIGEDNCADWTFMDSTAGFSSFKHRETRAYVRIRAPFGLGAIQIDRSAVGAFASQLRKEVMPIMNMEILEDWGVRMKLQRERERGRNRD